MPSFTNKLLKWHEENPRPLPWSDGKRDPYRIWLSEVIMQQTRVEQGTPYYLKFVSAYPTVHHLAKAPQDDIMKLWEGLGYYSRARNLHKAAKYIVESLDGHFPDSYESLIKLPGIGPYSAAAISSFAYGHAHVVVDGNVKRLVTRYAGIQEPIDEPATLQKISTIAEKYLNGSDPAVFNQAIMNFGALVCKPKPLCQECTLSSQCYAHKNKLAATLPVRIKKLQKKDRFFHFFILRHRGKLLLEKREGDDIWNGLYAPPLLETRSVRTISKSRMASFIDTLVGHDHFVCQDISPVTKQELSHQRVNARFYRLELKGSKKAFKQKTGTWIPLKKLPDLGKPVIVKQGIYSIM